MYTHTCKCDSIVVHYIRTGGNADGKGGWGNGRRLNSTAKLCYNLLLRIHCTATIPMNFPTLSVRARVCRFHNSAAVHT